MCSTHFILEGEVAAFL